MAESRLVGVKLVAVVAAVVGAVTWIAVAHERATQQGPVVRQYSMQTYESVSSLAHASDAFVVGAVLNDGIPSKDRGFDPPPAAGAPDPSLPVIVYKFKVDTGVASAVQVPPVIDIVLPAGTTSADGITPFRSGQRLAMFLLHFEKTGVQGLKSAWVPASYDNGEFVVSNGSAIARSAQVRSLDENTAPVDDGNLSTTVDSLVSSVKGFGVKRPVQVATP